MQLGMKTWKLILIIMLAVLILSNTAPANRILEPTITDDCRYSNFNGSFTFEEMQFQSRDFDMCLRKFNEFKKQNHTDTVLYRLCKNNYLKFWKYHNYFFSEKFRLPYMSWTEIEARRGPIENKSPFQDF